MLVGVAYSDSLVFESLSKLLEDDPTGRVSHAQIKQLSGVPDRTLQRCLQRLVDGRKIEREFKPGAGYIYRIP
jgi:hypothetical protein